MRKLKFFRMNGLNRETEEKTKIFKETVKNDVGFKNYYLMI